MKRIPLFEILLAAVVLGSALYAALSEAHNFPNQWFTRDDAYYYFKVAQNISEGRGSTFDGINRTNGYHPLWLWINTPIFALARFDLILPLRILLLVMSGLTAATAILLYRLIGKVLTPAIGAIAAIYWAFSKDVLIQVYQQGLETGIAAFFIVLFAYKLYQFEKSWRTQPVTTKQLAGLGVIAVLVIFSRLDLVFLAGVAGIWIVFRKYALRYLLPLDMVSIAVSALLAVIYFVTFKEYYKFSSLAIRLVVLALLIKLPAACLFGLYQRSVVLTLNRLLKRLAGFAISVSVILDTTLMFTTTIKRYDGFLPTFLISDLLLTLLLLGSYRLGMLGLRSGSQSAEDEPSPLKLLASQWKIWLAEGAVYYGIIGGALGVYMLWNKLAFGTFFPVSGQIKRWWGSLEGKVYGGSARNALTFFGIDYRGEGNAWHPASNLIGSWAQNLPAPGLSEAQRYLLLLAVFALAFYLLLWLDKRKARNAIVQFSIIPLVCAAWIQVLSYHITGYSAFKEWYWTTQLITVVILLSLMVGMVYQPLRKFPAAQTALWLAAVFLGLSMGASHWRYIQATMPHRSQPAGTPYNDMAKFLEAHTEPGSLIGITGGGNVGYFIKDRTIVNLDGLINSYEYFQYLKKGQAGAYLAEIGMDYLLANIDIINNLPYAGQYAPYLEQMNLRYGGKNLMRYHPILQP
ncbi:MAG: hypothetical protein ACP5QU_03440 [Anaerolineae bacterium]